MGGKNFRKAYSLYHKKKYDKVIQFLEPQVFRFRENFDFFYLLGMACLNTGDIGGGYSYLSRANNLNPKDVNTLLGMAAVYLKKQETPKALTNWFAVLDIDPNNKTAKKGLKLLRKYSKEEDLIDFLDSGKLDQLLPASRIGYSPILKILLFTAALSLVSLGGYKAYTYFYYEQKPQNVREGIAGLDIKAVVNSASNNIYTFTEKELSKELALLKKYFNDYDDNNAMREVNRIILSNASESVKSRALVLKNYLIQPTMATLKTNFTYEEVLTEPLLYENCTVLWKGGVSNLDISENLIKFDLLVGYEDGKILKGIVPVILDFAVKIDPARSIEVLGTIEYTRKILVLRGKSIHQWSQVN